MRKEKLKKFVPLLKVLNRLKTEDRSVLIDYLSNDSCECLSSVVENALNNNSISSKGRQLLKSELLSQKNDLRYIANKNKGIAARRKRIKQLGGGLGTIIGILLPLITSLFTKK